MVAWDLPATASSNKSLKKLNWLLTNSLAGKLYEVGSRPPNGNTPLGEIDAVDDVRVGAEVKRSKISPNTIVIKIKRCARRCFRFHNCL
jgi:hypothetical protein